MDWVRYHFTKLGAYAAHPVAFVMVLAYALIWTIISPASFEWHGLATIVTLLIALFIQRSTYRDTQAIHAKLDELLRSYPAAKTELTDLDGEEPESIEAFRKRQRARGPEP